MTALPWERTKDPDDVLDYEFDWNAGDAPGLDDGDVIVTSTFPGFPAGITKVSDSHTNTTVTLWLSGGTDGETYEIVNRIVTNGGRTMDQTGKLKVKTR